MTTTPPGHENECPKCRQGDHAHCLEDPSVGAFCDCAEGGHL